jgi:hypothetical protein
VDRLNAIRLIDALRTAGATADAAVAASWIKAIALEIGLKGEELHAALVYAGAQGWLNNDQKDGWTSFTGAIDAQTTLNG